jgi:hypothetical protein
MPEAIPKREEINSHTIKLIIGIIALSLPIIVSCIAHPALNSISESYIAPNPWTRNIFVGFLFAIAAFLFAYNGQSTFEMLLSRAAAICAIGVSVFECECGRDQLGTNVHMVFAVGLFIILAGFCIIFLRRAQKKSSVQAKGRVVIYAVCCLILLSAMLLMALDMAKDNFISKQMPTLIFWGESGGLAAFGIAWLVASRTLPFITAESERNSLSPYEEK